MNKLKKLAHIAAIPLAVLIAPACASLGYGLGSVAADSRMLMFEALGGEHDGPQDDGSYIKCLPNGSSVRMAELNFEARSKKYDPSKKILTEELVSENGHTTCTRAYHEEMGAKLEKTNATAMDIR